MGRLSENAVLIMKNKSFSITAEIEVPSQGAEGVILAQGGAFGGMSLTPRPGKQSSPITSLLFKLSLRRQARQFQPVSTRCVWNRTMAAG